ncbi:MAG TPA: 4-carboxy-4-hydroxy-2-oxoadipate aldolase/oxaloacetate decarboxylase [Aliidongia sp.]|uniref:4-carboxy-4-hydroxy-2-oxoadipate aldolase/oxaloacetate decarboxylase n=1 Tax=Aliidongia sp. TaxID=1914230 RepID=UPI002DDCB438|nr:4-carboxy-4-hydroxy-2-oxoadipate aldolase/oxaloacetate decarboxylase [Aliidongia sp.]HEV2673110.1 4-carboxy-4-hydroxy-2-oxoadipate aldolase/oxaloacetate decarboxylase [Aliidongia sp.]
MDDVPHGLSLSQIDSLKRLGAATIHEAQGQTGALTCAIKPIDPDMCLVGTALTVDVVPGDNLVIHHALTRAQAGDVLVVDAKGFVEAGPWGDILTTAAKQAGIVGLVIDGAVRDANVIIKMGFPVFARGLSIRGTQKNQPGRINVPIICGGVRIEPGDIIVGDRDGVVAVSRARLDDMLTAATKREAVEMSFRRELESGKTTVELLNLQPVIARLGMS